MEHMVGINGGDSSHIGIGDGAIYAMLGLGLVVIYRSTGLLNFAQGEMAMFSTYLSWQLMTWGLSFWAAFIVAVALSFVMGVLIERLILRPLHNAPVLSIIVVFIGLLAIFVLHVVTAIRLSRANKAARPVAYAKEATVVATFASRSMAAWRIGICMLMSHCGAPCQLSSA